MLKTTTALAAIALLFAGAASAGPRCSDGPDSNWIPAEQMQQQIRDQGYQIKTFKTTSGGCYEIYGWDEAERKVEIYFHPVSGEIIKQKIKE